MCVWKDNMKPEFHQEDSIVMNAYLKAEQEDELWCVMKGGK